jgi:tripartite-type tricarboxylate transporter receptor subunit TctC
VGAPGQSPEAAAYYQGLFETIYNTPEWQGYMESESLSPLWMNPEEQQAYWALQIDRHRELLATMEQ